MWTIYGSQDNPSHGNHIPGIGYFREPRVSCRLQGNRGIYPTSYGLVDDGMLLLLQQRNQLLFGADVAPDAPVGVVEETDDGGLFGKSWEKSFEAIEVICI